MSALNKYLLLSFPISSFGLGVWQIKRLEWKKTVMKELEEKIRGDTLDLKQVDSLEELEYRRLRTRGRYDQDPTHQLYLAPRGLVVNREAVLRGKTKHQSNTGVNVVTPFHVEDSDLRILVNRGWLPKKGDNDAPLEKGVVDLVGIVRKSDQRPRYGLKNRESTNEWQVRDVESIARVLQTAPIFLDADEDYARQEGPIGGQTQLNVRNEHLNYAITWFSLAAFAYLMWYSKYGKHMRYLSKLHR